MTARNLLRRGTAGLVLAASFAVLTTPSFATAGTSTSAEFERITADIRASIMRHDARAFRTYEVQLRRLVAEATSE
jgi:hypothetical protein